jgi:hypothetical protein
VFYPDGGIVLHLARREWQSGTETRRASYGHSLGNSGNQLLKVIEDQLSSS